MKAKKEKPTKIEFCPTCGQDYETRPGGDLYPGQDCQDCHENGNWDAGFRGDD